MLRITLLLGFTLSFSSCAQPEDPASGEAPLQSGGLRPIPRPYMGFNGNHHDATDPGWKDPQFAAVVASLDPELIRYPGGSIGNYWDYQTGCTWPLSPERCGLDSGVVPEGKSLAASGIDMVYMPNMLVYNGKIATRADDDAQIADQLGMLATAKNAGLDVSMIELGNEFYHAGDDTDHNGTPDYKQRFPTASDYVAVTNKWITKVRAAYPAAKISAVGLSMRNADGDSDRLRTWNPTVSNGLLGEDALTMHVYINVEDPMPSLEELLGYPDARWHSMSTIDLPAVGGRPVWITEFNMDDGTTGGVATATWAQALFVASMYEHFISSAQIEMILLHNITGGGGGINGGTLEVAPAGFIAQSFNEAEQSAVNVESLSFAAPLATSGGTTYPTVLGSAFWGPTATTAVVVNLGAKRYDATFPKRFAGTYTARITTATDPMKQMNSAQDPNLSTAIRHGTGTVTLPPHSFAVIQWTPPGT